MTTQELWERIRKIKEEKKHAIELENQRKEESHRIHQSDHPQESKRADKENSISN